MRKRSIIGTVVFLFLLLTMVSWWDLKGRGVHDYGADNNNTVTAPEEIAKDHENKGSLLPDGQLRVHFIDVGQGDAILIQTPEKNVLIDGGERGSTAVNYIQSQGITGLDLVIGTHPHSDHIGGLINVLQLLPVGEIIDPGVVHTTKTFENYLTLIDKKDIKFTVGRTGLKRDLGGGAVMQILHPSSPSSARLNDASIVARVVFGSVSFLFTGDAESAAETEILNSGCDLTGTVLKVGHHGSRKATTRAFLNAVKPEIAVIMCGRDNTYGYPHKETLGRLGKAGADVYRTDKEGTIVITTDGVGYTVKQNRNPTGE